MIVSMVSSNLDLEKLKIGKIDIQSCKLQSRIIPKLIEKKRILKKS